MRSMFHPWLLSSVPCKGWVRTLERGTALMQGSRMPGIGMRSYQPHGDCPHHTGDLRSGLRELGRKQQQHPWWWLQLTQGFLPLAGAGPEVGTELPRTAQQTLVGLPYLAHISVHLFIKLSKTSTASVSCPKILTDWSRAETGVSQKAFVSLEGNPGARLT